MSAEQQQDINNERIEFALALLARCFVQRELIVDAEACDAIDCNTFELMNDAECVDDARKCARNTLRTSAAALIDAIAKHIDACDASADVIERDAALDACEHQ
jgi:hypothetical protein